MRILALFPENNRELRKDFNLEIPYWKDLVFLVSQLTPKVFREFSPWAGWKSSIFLHCESFGNPVETNSCSLPCLTESGSAFTQTTSRGCLYRFWSSFSETLPCKPQLPHQAQIPIPVSLPAMAQLSGWQFGKDLQSGSWGECTTCLRSFLSFQDNNPKVLELVG